MKSTEKSSIKFTETIVNQIRNIPNLSIDLLQSHQLVVKWSFVSFFVEFLKFFRSQYVNEFESSCTMCRCWRRGSKGGHREKFFRNLTKIYVFFVIRLLKLSGMISPNDFQIKSKNAPSSQNNWWSKTFSRHWAFSFYPNLCNQEFNKCAFSSIQKHTMCVFKFLCQQTQPFLTSVPENWNISASKGRLLHPILFFRLRQTRRK